MRPFTNGTVLRAVSDAAYPFWPRDRRVCQIQGQLKWAHGWYKPWKDLQKEVPTIICMDFRLCDGQESSNYNIGHILYPWH